MSNLQKILFFFVLPIIAYLAFPPASLLSGIAIVPIVILLFVGLGILIWRGRSLALTFSIFLQGLNVIIRLMLFYPHALKPGGGFDLAFSVAILFGLAVSFYLMLRLDRPDVRVGMVA